MRKYLVFGVVGLVLLLSSMAGTSVAVAFPQIISSFHASLILAGWVMSANQLAFTITAALAGKTSDILGKKRAFMLFLSLFALGSLLCSIAPNIELLILLRFIQGIGAGGFLPSAAGIVAEEFPESRQRAIGLFSSIFPIGMIIGPNVGALLTDALGWRSVFWINIPIAIFVLIAAAVMLRPGKREQSHIDAAGAGLFAISLLTFMVALTMIDNDAIPWALVPILFLASIVFIVIFIRKERKVKDPIIDPEILTKKQFLAAHLFSFITGACFTVGVAFAPLYAVSVYNMTTIQSGVIMTPRSVAAMLVSTVTALLLLRLGYRRPLLFGVIFAGLTFVFFGLEPTSATILGIHLSGTVLLLIIMGLSGLAVGTIGPAFYNAIIELIPERVSTIMGIMSMFSVAGGTVGIAAVTLVLNSSGDMGLGFRNLYFGLAIILFLTIPLVFLLPSRARDLPATDKTK